MNELVVTPSNKTKSGPPTNPLNNKLLLLIPLAFFLFNSKNGEKSIGYSISSFVEKHKDRLTLDNISKKVETLKKVGPYLPESTIGTLNSIVLVFEKINGIAGLMEFITSNKAYEPIVAVKTNSQKEKMNKIFIALEEDLPDDKAKTIKPMMDLVMNFDKYKGMLNMVSSLAKPSSKSEGNSLEDMIGMVMPLIGGDDGKNGDKMKDMLQMFEILNVLNTPNKKDKD